MTDVEQRTAVVDCDSHVMEPADLWETYLEPKYRDRAIRIAEVDGVESLIMDGEVILAGVLAGLGGANLERSQLMGGGLKYEDGCPKASYDPAARAAMLDEWGVDIGVLFPTVGILPFPAKDQELASAYCRAYNTWQAEFSQSIPGRTAPVAHLNLKDLHEAKRELQRCIDLGFKGVFLPPEPQDGVRPGQAHFDPLWRMCAEAGLPLCIHVIVRFSGAGIPFQPWQETSPGMVFGFGLGATGQIIPCATAMVTDGVFDRIPDLKVVCVEAGCGWAAYVMDRLDEKYDLLSFGAPPLEMRPSEYFRRNLWFVAEPEERTIGAMLELVGEDRILWGSDFPHIDSTLEAPHLIRRSVGGLSPERRTAVLGGNALPVFGLS